MFDIAISRRSGDFILGPNRDLAGVTAQDVNEQRIYIRCRIPRGVWRLDFTNGTLGSHLRQLMAQPHDRALVEGPLYVRQALEPMDDIAVNDVAVQIEDLGLQASISYETSDEVATDIADTRTVTVQVPT